MTDQDKLYELYCEAGSPNIEMNDPVFDKIEALVNKIEAEKEAIERAKYPGHCQCCDIGIYEERELNCQKAWDGSSVYAWICRNCNKFDPMEL